MDYELKGWKRKYFFIKNGLKVILCKHGTLTYTFTNFTIEFSIFGLPKIATHNAHAIENLRGLITCQPHHGCQSPESVLASSYDVNCFPYWIPILTTPPILNILVEFSERLAMWPRMSCGSHIYYFSQICALLLYNNLALIKH